MKTLSTLFLTASLGLVSTLAACDSEPKKASTEPAAGADQKIAPDVVATRVEVAKVQLSSATIRLVRPGEVEPSRDANLASPTGGLIEKVTVEVGDIVNSGTTLAKVDSSLMGAQASLARVEVDDATRELERLKSMGGAIAQVRVDAAKTRLARAKAQSRITSIQSGRTYIKAPFEGLVSRVPMERGEVAPPGGVLVRLIQIDPAVISVSVADRDVGTLELGGDAAVTAAGQSRPLIGKVAHIEPAADLQTRSFKVEVEVPNAEGKLRPGMIATVDFKSVVADKQMIIPQDFLVTKLDANGVFVVDSEDVARWRPLELGAVVTDQVVVEAGLKPGERIVIVGHRGLADGDALLIAREGECCTQGRVRFPSDQAVAAAVVPDAPSELPDPPGGEADGEEAAKAAPEAK